MVIWGSLPGPGPPAEGPGNEGAAAVGPRTARRGAWVARTIRFTAAAVGLEGGERVRITRG